MNPIGLIFTLVASALLLTLPKRLAAIPLLMGAAYMTRGQELEVGLAHFPVVRILVMVGVFRVMSKGERITGGLNHVDRFLILWAIWLFSSSVFHTSGAWVFRAGMIWSDLGSYFLFRIFIQDTEDILRIFKNLCVILIPVTVLMLLEKITGKNFFAALGGVNPMAALRDGHFRAQGPFAHAILAGTAGAGCFPMALYFWNRQRKYALLGMFSAGGIVFASTSSGPIMMVFLTLFGLMLWKVSKYLSAIRWMALMAIIGLDAIMKDPVYYLMAQIDLGGGSKGWHRARLIESSIEHLNEWWLAGTDYTRHWMPTGVHSNEVHTDITNHLLAMGVMGGLPLMFLWIMVLIATFAAVGKALRQNENTPVEQRFLIWTLGAIMFGHVANYFSISYFDQSIVFFYLLLASISTVQVAKSFSDIGAKQPVYCITQSRYVAVGMSKAREGIKQQKTHSTLNVIQRINLSAKVCWPRHSKAVVKQLAGSPQVTQSHTT
ncbi:MAG: hypothetical protein ACXW00_00950 [Methylobacter sp.]|jgi:hypothetical protein